MLDLLAGTAMGTASHMHETAWDSMVNDHYDSEHQRREFNYNQKAMAAQAVNNQLALQNSPESYVLGLKKAGMNPALAVQPQMAAGSSALPTSGSGHAIPGTSNAVNAAALAVQAQKQAELTESEIDLNESQTAKNFAEAGKPAHEIELLKAQTVERKINNRRLADADKAAADQVSSAYRNMAEEAGSQLERDLYLSMSRKAETMTVGGLQASMMTTDWLRGLSEYDKDVVLNLVHKYVGQLQLGNHADLKALADMPLAQFKQFMAHVEDLNSSRLLRDVQRREVVPLEKQLLNAQAGNLYADTDLKGSQSRELEARAAAIPIQLDQAKHKNFVQMVDEGEYGNAAWYMLENVINMVLGVLAFRYAGKAGSAGANPREEIQETLDTYKTETFNYSKKGKLMSKETTVQSTKRK